MKKLWFIGLMFLSVPSFAVLNIGDLVTISNDVRFQSRVNYYLNLAAINVLSEANTTASHFQRAAFSKSVIATTQPLVGSIGTTSNPVLQKYGLNVLTNTTIAGEATLAGPDFAIPDSDINFAVNSLFNDWAGVSN
jgi:hypothetical protein